MTSKKIVETVPSDILNRARLLNPIKIESTKKTFKDMGASESTIESALLKYTSAIEAMLKLEAEAKNN